MIEGGGGVTIHNPPLFEVWWLQIPCGDPPINLFLEMPFFQAHALAHGCVHKRGLHGGFLYGISNLTNTHVTCLCH